MPVALAMAAVIAGHRWFDEALGFAGGPDEMEPREAQRGGGRQRRGSRVWPRQSRRRRHAHVPRNRLPDQEPDLLFIHRYSTST